MPRITPTAVETYDAQHPGLQQFVAMRLDDRTPIQIIAKELHQRFEVVIPEKTLSNYKQRRWLPAQLRIQALTEQTEAIMRIVREHGANEITTAYILEELADAKERNEKAPVEVLLREQRARAQLVIAQQLADLETQRVQIEKQALQLKLDELYAERERIRDLAQQATSAASQPDKTFDAAAVYRQISEIIGLGGPPEDRIEPQNTDTP